MCCDPTCVICQKQPAETVRVINATELEMCWQCALMIDDPSAYVRIRTTLAKWICDFLKDTSDGWGGCVDNETTATHILKHLKEELGR